MSVESVSATSAVFRSYSAEPRFSSYAAGPRLRITRRGRAVVTLLVVALLAVVAAMVGVGATGASAGTQATTSSFHYVTVQPGESLWQLAESIAPKADPRDVIADVQNLNNLSSGQLQPGQRLAIPSKYDS